MPTFIDSTSLIDDPPALRDRLQRDGHLFVSGLLPADELEALRLRFLAIARDAGWVQADTPLEGRYRRPRRLLRRADARVYGRL